MGFFNITVEVPIFLSFFSFLLTGSVFTNLIIFRTCYLTLGYNKSECALLGTTYNNETDSLEKLVEPHAAVITMARSTIESIFSILLCLFMGPWSDKFGRKPVLILNLLGFSCSLFGISIFSYFENISPWYALICSIPIMITGGTASYLAVALSYLTEITSEETRGTRMAIFEAVLVAGILMGNVSSSYLFYATNYMSVFGIAAGACALAILYTIFFIPESLQNRQTEGRLRGFFQVSNIFDMVKTTFKKREHFKRAIILLNLMVLTLYIFTIDGDTSVMFLYLREKFDWTLTKFALFNSASNVIWIVGTMGGTFLLHQLLHIKEPVLLTAGFICIVISALLQGIGDNDWYIYAAGLIRCPGGVISPMARSLVSKQVSGDEIAKIFSLIMICEFLLSLGASPLYTVIYNITINSNPGIFNYVTAAFYVFSIGLIICIVVMQNVSLPNYDQLKNEEEQETRENV